MSQRWKLHALHSRAAAEEGSAEVLVDTLRIHDQAGGGDRSHRYRLTADEADAWATALHEAARVARSEAEGHASAQAPYQLDADMMGSEFCGALGDLARFREILAAQCGRPIETLAINQHVSQPVDADEPTEHDWNTAIETFADERPELWSTHASAQKGGQ